MFTHENSFHSPCFSVEMTASAYGGTVVRRSREVRVDTRQNTYLGGLIASGDELVGHAGGKVDPIPWNSRTVADGAFTPGYLFAAEDRVDVMTNIVCVVNNVSVEGGTLTSNAVWKSDTVHLIRHNVFVPGNYTLTIEEGAILKFCQNTKIFVTWKGYADGNWNFAMKGCYIDSAANASVGGDTLNGCVFSGDTFSITDGYFFDDDFPDDIANVWDTKGIIAADLMKTIDGTHNYESWLKRFYSRNQPYGRLPHPVYSGEEFFGWILNGNNPWTDLDKWETGSEEYRNEYRAMTSRLVKSTDIVFPVGSSGNGRDASREKTLYAYSDTRVNQPENYAERIDGSGAKITLSEKTAVYNGAVQKPTVEVKVDEAVVPPENYDVVWGGDFTSVGTHTITISFKCDYSGSPSATFEITPCDASGATVTLSPATVRYSGAEQKPAVAVSLSGKTIYESDYDIDWGDGDWTAVGTYRLKVVFNGNYTGEKSADFTIEENPDLEVVFYTSRAAALARVNEAGARRADGSKRRILFVSGREDDIPTRWVKHCLADVPRIRNIVIANFVCWYDDCDADKTEYPTYVRGLDSVALPLFAVLSANDMSKCVMREAGYMSEDEVFAFVQTALTEPEDASSATVTINPTSFEWDGTTKTPSYVNVTYAGKTVPAANYTVKYSSNARTEVGIYTATVEFDSTKPYEGYSLTGETEPVAFQIVPKIFTDADVSLSPSLAVYNGRMQKPVVVVRDDPGGSYSVDYGDGDYVSSATYTIKVKFAGGAAGEVVKSFTISKANASSAVVSLDWYSAAADGTVKRPSVKSVVLGDYTFGEGEYTVSYPDDCKSVGTHRVVVSFKGDWTGSASAAFRLEVDPLPDVGDKAEIPGRLDGLGLPDAKDLANVKAWIGTDVEEYARFQDWVSAVGIDAVKGSTRVYESFRLSTILAAPQILGDSDEVKIKISDFDMGGGESSTWELKVSVVCEDGEDPVTFMLSAVAKAKAAFAEMVRRSETLEGLDEGFLDPKEDIDAELTDGGTAVILSVKPPTGDSGFMTIKLQ